MARQRLLFMWAFASVFALAFILAGLNQPLKAQVGTASLSGAVTDPSGASIPGAQVSLESMTRKAARQTVTDATGSYVFTSLLPDTYQLVVTARGFATKLTENIALSSGQGSTLNVSMQLGATATEVTVTNVAPLLQTTTATLGAEVTSRSFVDLPLPNRNYAQILVILPGVSPLNSSDTMDLTFMGNMMDPSVYGQRQRDNEFMIDGAPNQEAIFEGQPLNPPPEAIQEMKVESGMTAGAAGWASGASVNVVTKSGTRNLHGDAWEYLQNSALNSRSFFSPSVVPFRYNQFGGALGGPLVIPHVLSSAKAWYVFGYYEGARVHTNSTNTATLVPTAAQMSGDFSAAGTPTIYNPYTSVVSSGVLVSRTAFPNNIIPTGSTTLCAPQPTCIDPATLLLAQTMYPLPNLPSGVIPGANYLNVTPVVTDSNIFSGRVDHQFGAKDVLTARYSYSKWEKTSFTGTGIGSLGIKGPMQNIVAAWTHTFSPTLVATGRFGYDYVNIENTNVNAAKLFALPTQMGTAANYPGIGTSPPLIPTTLISGYPNISASSSSYGPSHILTWTGDLQKIHGRHSLDVGGLVTRTAFFTASPNQDQVTFLATQTASASSTQGYALASFLLGLPATAGRLLGNNAALEAANVYSLYLQDTFRVTRKLTLNLGLRYDYASTPVNSDGSGTFDMQTGQYYYDKTNPITGALPNAPPGIFTSDHRNFQPRLGFAYQINAKTVLRASYAVFTDTFGENYAQSTQGDRGSWPYAIAYTVGATTGLNTGIPNGLYQNPFASAVQTTVPEECVQCMYKQAAITRTPYVQERTISLERQITPSLVLEVAYFGSLGVKISGQTIDNVAPSPGLGSVASRVPYPSQPVLLYNEYNDFDSWYNGGSLRLTKRFSHNLSGSISYTYSKTMDLEDALDNGGTTGVQAIRVATDNIQANKGLATFGIPHLFSMSYIYQIPGHPENKALNALAGNWSLSGILTADSGVPTYVALSTDNENTGAATYGAGSEFPNILCNPMTGGPFTTFHGFNTACYQLPTFGTRGNAGKHSFFPNDGQVAWNPAIHKQFPWGEQRHVEFRAEFFNVLNAHAFFAPGGYYGTPTFGQITNVRLAGRSIQFALKIHF